MIGKICPIKWYRQRGQIINERLFIVERRHLQQNVCEHGNKRGSSNRSKHTGHVNVSSNDGI